MLIKRTNVNTNDSSYFAGYNSDSENWCVWESIFGAVILRNKDYAEAILRFLISRADLKEDGFNYELIDEKRLQKLLY